MPELLVHALLIALAIGLVLLIARLLPAWERRLRRRAARRRTRQALGVENLDELRSDPARLAHLTGRVKKVGLVETARLAAPSPQSCARPPVAGRGSPTAGREAVLFVVDAAGDTWDLGFADGVAALEPDAHWLADALGVPLEIAP